MIKYFDIDVLEVEIEHNPCANGNCPILKHASDETYSPLDDIKQKKNHAYLYVIAMGAGDYYGENNNGDFFYEKDLKDYYKTFETAGVFIQHFNKDPEKSIGRVLKAIYNDDMHRVELILEISKEKAPDIYNQIKNGDRMKVSMGVKVPQEMCSYCGAITKNSLANRCKHLKFMMHQIMPNGQKVYAINMTPMNFFDISIVRRPADTQGHALFQKVASQEDNNVSAGGYMDKIAELIKYFDAIKSMPDAVSPDELDSMKKTMSPDAIKKIIIVKRITLLPSEAMFLGTPMTKEEFIRDSSILDSPEMLVRLITKQLDEPEHIKIASIDYSNPTIEKLEARTEIIKHAAKRRGYSDIFGNSDSVASVPETKKTVKNTGGKFSQFRVRMNNGDEFTVNSRSNLSLFSGKGTDIPDYYFELVDRGFAHSISGILPTGNEQIVYMRQ